MLVYCTQGYWHKIGDMPCMFFAFFPANHFTYRADSTGSKWSQLMDLKLDENQMETDSFVLAKISFYSKPNY